MLLQIMPYIGQFAGAAVGGEKGKRIAETSAAFGELLGMTGKITKAFGSPSTGLKIGEGIEGVGPLADPKDYIGGLTGSIADKTQQNFAGVKDMMIGSPTNPYNEQASIYNPFV
jgi:hypothetical protein